MLLSLGLVAATGLSGMALADGDKVTTLKEPPAVEQQTPDTPQKEDQATPHKNPVLPFGAPVKVSEYWIGVQGGEIQPPLQAHLGLEENEGVLVEWVAPDSPADKAGVKQYDVILKVNDTPVNNVGDIVKKVEETKDKELTLAIIRKSKPEELKLTPAKRPDNAKSSSLPQQQQRSFNSVHPGVIIEQFGPFEKNGNTTSNIPEEFRQMIEQMQKQMPQLATPDGNIKKFRDRKDIFRASPNASNTTTMQISIEPGAEGNGSGTLTVRKNGQTWSVSQFSDLPENVQKDVAEMLKNSIGDKNVGDWISEQMKSGRRLTFSVTISGNTPSEDHFR
jgi:membrane-associated protease RseP (regulator of RpoE activity)